MEYCYSGTESLWYGSWNRHVCRKGKCAADRPSRSTGVNPSRMQRCCSMSCLSYQAQRNTSDQDNSKNLGYLLTIRHRCICMWSWTEMLTFSFELRAKTVWIPLRMSTEICRLGEGHNLCPLECRLSVGKSLPPPPKTTKIVSTRNSSMLMISSSVYLVFRIWVVILLHEYDFFTRCYGKNLLA